MIFIKIFLLGLLKYVVSELNVNIEVDTLNAINKLEQFWASTGLSPPEPYNEAGDFLLDKDMEMNLVLIGAWPRNTHSGHQFIQVRIHWLLNLIKIKINRKGYAEYNFKDLDRIVETLYKNQLKPGFELMGNPSGFYNDFENKTQIYQWRQMVTILAKRYISKFGLQYVKQWNFESWNEPDHQDFNGLNFTIKGFLNYYDACSEGLSMAHPSLRLGGPAESFHGKFINYCWSLLDHCVNGKNYFTGQTGVRLDFISIHKKGNQSSRTIIEEEMETIREIYRKYPKLTKVSIYNDEADPMVGWWKPEAFRSDNTYAAMVAKVIVEHVDKMSSTKLLNNYGLLSNDNGFLPFEPHYFEQRTLIARFRKNKTETETEIIKNTHVAQMIRKPVYLVTGLLLHVLGEHYVKIRQNQLVNPVQSSYLGALAAYHFPAPSSKCDSWNLGVIVYNSDDLNSSSENDANLNITIKGLNNSLEIMYVTYSMDNVKTNPAAAWEAMGRPDFPNEIQLKTLRKLEGPITSKPRAIGNSFEFQLEETKLRQPGFLAIHFCSKSQIPPGQVTNVRVHNVSVSDVIVTWQTDKLKTKCIRTFEIELKVHRKYRRISGRHPNIFRSFQFQPTPQMTDDDRLVHGFYRVRAIDYWSRRGRWSAPTSYGV